MHSQYTPELVLHLCMPLQDKYLHSIFLINASLYMSVVQFVVLVTFTCINVLPGKFVHVGRECEHDFNPEKCSINRLLNT